MVNNEEEEEEEDDDDDDIHDAMGMVMIMILQDDK
jgi:hypothetical protein